MSRLNCPLQHGVQTGWMPALVLTLAASGTAVYLSRGETAASTRPIPTRKTRLPFQVPPGFIAERVAGPPLVVHPMFAAFDDRGRLFVAESAGLNPPADQLRQNPPNSIRLLQDRHGDGRFDRGTVFADKLTYPEGVVWYDGAVYTATPPSLWRLFDTNRHGVANRRQELITGFPCTGIADDIHGSCPRPDGMIYWGGGRFAHEIRRPGDRIIHRGRAPLILRCRPDGSDAEVVCGAMGNPVKLAFTDEGEPFACGTWATRLEAMGTEGRGREDTIIHCVEGGDYPMLDGDFFAPEHRHTRAILPPLVYLGVAAASGLTRYQGSAFGTDYTGNLFSALYNMHKVQRHVVDRDGASFRARTEDFLVSSDPDFHPTDVLEDADGSLLVVDTGSWFSHCPTSHVGKSPVPGAIYRVRRRGVTRPADPRGLALRWDRLAAVDLARLLDDPRFAVRDRAVSQLAKLGARSVAVLRDVLRANPAVRARRNAIWALNRINGPEARAAVRLALADRDVSPRLTAAHAVGLHRDAAALDRLVELVSTDAPPVRREAAAALGRIRRSAAVPALFTSLRAGGDRFLEHALIYALIEIAGRPATLAGLQDTDPVVRRAALVALDQMDGGNLSRELVTPLLNTDDPELRRTALAIITSRPGWAGQVLGLVRTWLTESHLAADRQESLRGAVLAFCTDPTVQDLVARALERPETPTTTRLVLLEAIARAPLDRLPAAWVAEVGRSLAHPDPRVVRQAVACLRAGQVSRFDAVLRRLGSDQARPDDLRVTALGAVARRLARVDGGIFRFLTGCLDSEKPPLVRLAAAGALGDAHLDDHQLRALAGIIATADALEVPRLVAAFEHSSTATVGRELVAALARSPGLANLAPETLRRTLNGYPAAVRAAAEPLLNRLAVDTEHQGARLKELEPVLRGGDPGRGRDVFFGKKVPCATCHSVQSRGGRVGPDLSKVGAIRSGRDLLEAIVVPSASIVRGYESYVIGTRDGVVYTGLIVRETAEAVYLRTVDRAEVRVPRSVIETMQQSRVSIMPQGLDTQLSRQELADLIAFLRSLK